MADAVGCHVNIFNLQNAVGEKFAALTNNELAYVSNGAEEGLAMATAACMTGDDAALIVEGSNDRARRRYRVLARNRFRNRSVGLQ